jgi:hypothetical protein
MKSHRFAVHLFCVAALVGTPLGTGCGGGGGGGGGGSGSGTAAIMGNVSSTSTAGLDAEKRSWLAWAEEELLGLARRAYAAPKAGPAGVSVQVAGNGRNSSADTDGNGHFTIGNAPTGDVMVSFGSGDCEAPVALNDVTNGSTLNMRNVAIDCNRATVGELDETFQAVIENKPVSANGNLNVCAFGGGGNHIRAVKTREAEFENSGGEPLTFNDLQDGDLIEVTGRRAGIGANSAVDASMVTLVSSGQETGNCAGLPTPTPVATGTPSETPSPVPTM